MLGIAKDLLKNGKRYKRQDDQVACRFTYVNLNRAITDHVPFFELMDLIADGRRIVHPRLSEYDLGDFCTKHIDTIPGVIEAVSVRFDSGPSRLIVDDLLVREGEGIVVRFNPKQLHEVLPIEVGTRVVLIFWLGE